MGITRVLFIVLSIVLFLTACRNPVEPDKEIDPPAWQSVNNGLDFLIVDDLQINPASPEQIYAATMNNFYKTSDGAESWRPIVSGLNSSYIYCTAVHPKEFNQIYCGTKLGVYTSADSGENWQSISTVSQVGAVNAFSVSENGTLWAGTLMGLFRSVDGGVSWTFMDVGQYQRISAVAAQPGQPQTVVVSVRYLGNFITRDNGENWHAVNGGVFSDWWGVDHALQFLYEPNAGEWWMATALFDLYRSAELGGDWVPIKGALADQKVVSVACNFDSPSRIWAAALRNGVYETLDRGQTWTEIGKAPPESDVSVLRATRSGVLFLATRGSGVFKLSDF